MEDVRVFKKQLSSSLALIMLLTAPEAPGQTPAPRAGQPTAPAARKLTGEDARRAEELLKTILAAQEADRWDEAIARAEEMVALRTKVQGPNHYETLTNRVGLKNLRRFAAMSPEGRAAYRAADTDTMTKEALDLYAQGKYAEAQPLFQKVLDVRRRLLSDDHPDTAAAYIGLAADLAAQGKHAEAQPLFEKALDVRRRLLGDDHPDTAQSVNGLATDLYAQGNYAAAQPLFERALATARRWLGDDHPGTAFGYNDLAADLDAQGKYAEAQPLPE
jgi:tetratricopeptide (TPR) repeat protein